ncbi:aminotransferase class I and II domain-containing protein [Ditylenchus destructor]|nr:aminotransferase class I and II domain-containing protein [Ditylenchus destructor]
MDLAQRERLVSIARQHNLMIIEDAAYAFLAENAPPPVATLAPERTVYVGGLSKSVATGLRVGFVAAPSDWVKTLERAIMATTWNVPGVMSAIAGPGSKMAPWHNWRRKSARTPSPPGPGCAGVERAGLHQPSLVVFLMVTVGGKTPGPIRSP